jgi:glucokinase
MSSRPEPIKLPFPVLVGDIGGTNARFAQLDAPDAELHIFPTAATADYADPAAAIEAVVLKDDKTPPRTLIFALAGPVTGDRIKLTNCPWVFAPRDLIARLGVENVILLNDFEAQALALPSLGVEDLQQIGGGEILPEATKVVIGPGTGLGVGILAHADGIWIPIPGEGGHVSLAAETDRDIAIWKHLTRVEGRVTAESVISGPGMLNLYSAIARANGHEPIYHTPADITAPASASNPEVKETLELFGQHLGCVSGDFALTALARGGVYIGGGVSQHIAGTLEAGPFRAAFEAKPPHRALATSIPTFLIMHPMPALIGLAAYASHPDSYGVELKGRHWST